MVNMKNSMVHTNLKKNVTILLLQGGIYLLTLMDNYSAGFSLMLVSMFEAIIVSYVYGMYISNIL